MVRQSPYNFRQNLSKTIASTHEKRDQINSILSYQIEYRCNLASSSMIQEHCWACLHVRREYNSSLSLTLSFSLHCFFWCLYMPCRTGSEEASRFVGHALLFQAHSNLWNRSHNDGQVIQIPALNSKPVNDGASLSTLKSLMGHPLHMQQHVNMSFLIFSGPKHPTSANDNSFNIYLNGTVKAASGAGFIYLGTK